AHPFAYARIIKIFHADVSYVGPGATEVTRQWRPVYVLQWVRWFEVDTSYPSGFQHRRHPRVQFVDANDPDETPFGFVDPGAVIRPSYLMPAFNDGETKRLLKPSPLARQPSASNRSDGLIFSITMFIDRAMYMRYLGGGVGHREQGVSVARSREHAKRSKRTAQNVDADEDYHRDDDYEAEGFARL
ncbi:hypothetical protein K466DRAFT_491799, partial [Polyporus arcularius HHB13444]